MHPSPHPKTLAADFSHAPQIPLSDCSFVSSKILSKAANFKALLDKPDAEPLILSSIAAGQSVLTFKVFIASGPHTNDSHILTYDPVLGLPRFRITLVTTPINGGLQWWFLCPVQSAHCHTRVEKLFRRPDWQTCPPHRSPDACSNCNRLYYTSSRQPPPPARILQQAHAQGVDPRALHQSLIATPPLPTPPTPFPPPPPPGVTTIGPTGVPGVNVTDTAAFLAAIEARMRAGR